MRNTETLLCKNVRLEDCAGIFSGHADVVDLKKEIDKLREASAL